MKEKLYSALKNLMSDCIDEMGLPQKPTILALDTARKAIRKYEKEKKRHVMPPPPQGRIEIEGKRPQKQKNGNNL